MKKWAVVLAALMLFSTVGVSADSTEEMAAAIALVKTRVDIPAECTEFNGRKNVYQNETNWDFTWETPEKAEPRMYVSVNLRGDLIDNVSTYVSEDTAYKPGKTLPLITEDAAVQAAVSFAAKTNPAIAAQYAAEAEARLSGDSYNVDIPRIVDGIPVYNDNASVRVSSQTGKAESYYLYHTEKAVFPGTAGAMDVEGAKNAYVQNGYMRLEYRLFDGEARLVYTPGQSESLIDAAAGTGFNPADDLVYARNSKMAQEETMAAMDAASGASATLSPQERQAVEEAAGLISYEAAVEKLKSISYFRIPEGAVLEAGNTYKTEEGRYILRVSLGTNDETYTYTYGELDGVTGEILQYYTGDRLEEEATADAEAAKAVYDAFAAEHLSAYAANLAEKETENSEKSTYITAERTANGVPVFGNGVSVTVAPDGQITSYSLHWEQNAVFPAPEGIISAESAYGVLFGTGAPRLSYYAGDGQAAVIYAAAPREYAFIGATDGALLNYSGKVYIPTTKAAYTDVAGHYAEEAILALASVDARLGDTAFMPDAIITQSEFVGLVSSCVMEYYPLVDGALDEARLYSYAVNRGILPAEEEAPAEPLTRELAVAYLLRAMEYGDFAEIQGIFRCDFADADAINPALYGYVAIAKGLGIVSGDGSGNFAPTRQMTRGEAAVMIYNYLK